MKLRFAIPVALVLASILGLVGCSNSAPPAPQPATYQNPVGNGQASDQSSQIQALQNQLASANAQISSLQSQLNTANSQVQSLQGQLAAANSQISSLQGQLASVQSIQSQLSSLQSITSLSQSSTEANGITVNESSGAQASVVSFQAAYAGYIVVSGTSTTTNGYLMVHDSFGGYSYIGPYSFGTGATLYIPVLPGTVTVNFGNNNFMNGATATITVVYYY